MRYGDDNQQADDDEEYNDPEHESFLGGSSSSSDDDGDFRHSRRQPLEIMSSSSAITMRSSTHHKQKNVSRLWNQHWIPDGPWYLRRRSDSPVLLLDATTVHCVKFFLVTIASLVMIHLFAVITFVTNDETYGLREMVLIDGKHIMLDCLFFYVVGRLYDKEAVDTLAWIVPSLLTACVLGMLASYPPLHHSITPYEIHCEWSWAFWIAIVGVLLPAVFGLWLGPHFYHAYHRGCLGQTLVEIILSLIVFLVPYAGHPFFHLHHWYLGWLLGMHCNHNTWWSKLTMSLWWGVYLNGIAFFGRDPILTCAVTLYQSQNQECPYLIPEALEDENYALDLPFSFEENDDGSKRSFNCSSGGG